MSLHNQPELKLAVLNLPQKEKDKLLVRLVGKDKMLMKQLHYKLLESESDLEDRIESLRSELQELFSDSQRDIKNRPTYSYYKELQSVIRNTSGKINEHEKVTKDKFSEVEFRILILNESFTRYPVLFEKSSALSAFKLHEYVKARIKITVNKFDKLHEDLQFDLEENMQRLLAFASSHNLV